MQDNPCGAFEGETSAAKAKRDPSKHFMEAGEPRGPLYPQLLDLGGRQSLIADGDAEKVPAEVLGEALSVINNMDLEQAGSISEATRQQVKQTVTEILIIADQHLRNVERVSGETVQRLLPLYTRLAKLKNAIEVTKSGTKEFYSPEYGKIEASEVALQFPNIVAEEEGWKLRFYLKTAGGTVRHGDYIYACNVDGVLDDQGNWIADFPEPTIGNPTKF